MGQSTMFIENIINLNCCTTVPHRCQNAYIQDKQIHCILKERLNESLHYSLVNQEGVIKPSLRLNLINPGLVSGSVFLEF